MILKPEATVVFLFAILNIGGTVVYTGCTFPLGIVGTWAIGNPPQVDNPLCCLPASEVTVTLDANGNMTFSAANWQGDSCSSSETNNMMSFSATLVNISSSSWWWGNEDCCLTPNQENCYRFGGQSGQNNALYWSMGYTGYDEGECGVSFQLAHEEEKLSLSLMILLIIACFFL